MMMISVDPDSARVTVVLELDLELEPFGISDPIDRPARGTEEDATAGDNETATSATKVQNLAMLWL
jgi:hypothetical protein